MPKKGENIYKRKDNRWEARYIKGYSPEGKIRFGYCYAKTYKEAKEKLLEAKSKGTVTNISVNVSKMNFSDWCEEWLTVNSKKLKRSTLIKYTSSINNHIKPLLGNNGTQFLDTCVISAFSDYLLYTKHLSTKTVKDILVLLKAIVKYASKSFPQLLNIDFIYPKEKKPEIRVMSNEEEERFIEFLMEDLDRCKLGILLSLFTGLRIGEICALRWGDISLTEETIVVRNTMQRIKRMDNSNKKTEVIINDPKSETSFRVIPLSKMANKICSQLMCLSPDAFILSGNSQRFVEPRVLQYRIKKYSKECGIPGLHFHVLRHTFATRCVEVGFEMKSLSEILGHSSPRVTFDRYIHPSMELKKENIDKLSAIGL